MSILELVDSEFLRDTLNQSTLKMIRAANTLERLLAQITIMDETARALRTRMWGGYLDYVGYLSSTSSIAGIYSEGGVDRYIIIKHILQPLLSDIRFLRAGIADIRSGLAKPNRYAKRTADLSVSRDNASLISEWGLSGKGPFASLTVIAVGTGSYTLRFYSTQTDYVEITSGELTDGAIFDALFVDLRMTNTAQTGVANPVFFIDWRE